MEKDISLTALIQRHRQGDPEAAAEIHAHYARRLSHVAEVYLSRKLAGRVEGEDVVQSVFRTFFHRCAKGEFQIDSRTQLWQLLVRITVTKAKAQGRRHTAASRDVNLEQVAPNENWLLEAVARDPAAEDVAVLIDQIETLLAGLPAFHAEVLQMRLAGYTVAEIAARSSVARQTVYRALDLLQERLTRTEGPRI